MMSMYEHLPVTTYAGFLGGGVPTNTGLLLDKAVLKLRHLVEIFVY